ncbi:hypothetical protein [Mucilaginibacter sp.]|uniref:hypothetical protein n=1 Tax=Mucilaginibacter sp. TaxID=1882438 RepID=UPI003267D907
MRTVAKISFVIFAIAIIAVGCTNKQGATPNASLVGKWRYVGSRMSNGGPQYWAPATNNNNYLQLSVNGTMEWTPGNEYKKYSLKDSVTLTMTHADGSNYQNYYYRIKGDSLGISPIEPIRCYEGCSEHFVKVK